MVIHIHRLTKIVERPLGILVAAAGIAFASPLLADSPVTTAPAAPVDVPPEAKVPAAVDKNLVEHQVIGAQLDFSWPHPFKTMRGTLRTVSGSMTFNPENPREGVRMNLTALLSALDSPDDALKAILMGSARKDPSQELRFHSLGASFPNERAPVALRGKWVFVGEVAVNGITQTMHLPLACQPEAEYWRCLVDFQFTPSDFTTLSPTVLRIPALNRISVKGDITFGPKRES